MWSTTPYQMAALVLAQNSCACCMLCKSKSIFFNQFVVMVRQKEKAGEEGKSEPKGLIMQDRFRTIAQEATVNTRLIFKY